MSASKAFTAYVMEQLEGCGEIRARRMFGGVGIYVDEVFCALISSSSEFFLRVDDASRADFEAEGMPQFSGKAGAGMPYYQVPPDVLEDRESLRDWVARARAAALAAKRTAPTARGRRPAS